MIYYQFANNNGPWFGVKASESNVCYQAKFSNNSSITNGDHYCICKDWLVATFTEPEFRQSFPEFLL